ncbi:GNAT family N-acetyltransferase [Candidatus Pantoea multigeneris]|uniref:GNAT family N-acetyltransferase n=1 Tax=Candidatus Pantoea multigeneris TaxID=2608357 RepID=A0ABX0RDJ1_9GAMM|nr:GNAT family N-acetyltransferase [Pantoea multigeneris]NIF23421.1 GNAT family N-acetyltransferase [Pantoea multigeneris]
MFKEECELAVDLLSESDLDNVALLFNDYRVFYQQKTDVSAAYNFISERFFNKESVVLVAKAAGKVVGFIQMYPSFSSVQARKIFILNDLFVRADYRQLKVGERLMRFSEAYAKKEKASMLVLETMSDNLTAKNLYKKRGYEQEVGVEIYALNLQEAE